MSRSTPGDGVCVCGGGVQEEEDPNQVRRDHAGQMQVTQQELCVEQHTRAASGHPGLLVLLV